MWASALDGDHRQSRHQNGPLVTTELHTRGILKVQKQAFVGRPRQRAPIGASMSTSFETQDQVLFYEGHEFRVRSLPGTDDQPPVVCIGGAFQNIDSWMPTANWFQPQRAMLLVDLPGMGDSPFLSVDFGLDFLSASLNVCLEEFEIEKASILSASYGSLISYRFAQLYPHRISHLALAGIMAWLDEKLDAMAHAHVENVRKHQNNGFANEIVSFLISDHVFKNVRRGRAIARVMKKQISRLSQEALRKYITNTSRLIDHEPLDLTNPPRVPTLVFTGEHDHLTPPHRGREVAEAIPGAYFTTIRDADHLCHLEQFDRCINLVSRFYNNETLTALPGCSDILRF